MADDVSKVMRQFLLRSERLTADDIGINKRAADGTDGGDLEVDAEDDGEEQQEKVQEVAHTLAKIGDEFQKQFEDNKLPSVNEFITKCVKQQTYAAFSESIRDICGRSSDVLNSDTKSVAFVMFFVQKLAEATKDAGGDVKNIRQSIIYGEMYVRKSFDGVFQKMTADSSSNQQPVESEIN